MNFIQPNFFIFLAVFLALYAVLGQRLRITFGIIASFYFYAYFSATYALLLIFSSVLDFLVGAKLSKCDDEKLKKRWLWLSLSANLGMLFYFKYDYFAYSSIQAILPEGMLPDMARSLPPMGISFFTFQTMSYTIDIYRGRLKPVVSFRHFLLYISFFPQLVAGPIVRARTFLPQIDKAKFDKANLWPGALRFARGFAKKACLADTIGLVLVDPLYASPTQATPMIAWLGMLGYGFQLYLDFSGYSDMAIGLGRMLGYTFPENFNYPYLSRSLGELWRRWHISLSSWIRDYIYASIRGRDKTLKRACLSLLISMALSGLWHGAGWTFVIFGCLHGLGLVLEKLLGEVKSLDKTPASLQNVIGYTWAVGAFFLSLVIFRANSLSDAVVVYKVLFQWSPTDLSQWWSHLLYFRNWEILIALGLGAGTHLWQALNLSEHCRRYLPLPLKVILMSSLVFWLIHFYPSGKVSPFIYFQF